ncbi:lipopolysaccharide biosynthesis protein [Chitinophaga sp. Hz27]|uniref:lipopolysaccharide biosynthesis protein n=1 Tax=Chitinophaga sp. Hz27 TaxID=3347169 RepID=UPI0035D801EE
MGIVRKQSFYSTISIYLGFAFGAFNLVVLMPKFLTQDEIGLTRVLIDVATLMGTVATLGTVPVINKFFPFYQDYLSPKKNDLPKLTAWVSIIGFVLFLLFALTFKGSIIKSFSNKSPLFIEYFYAIYPLTFFIMVYNLLEGFAWGLHKTVVSNFLKEGAMRMVATIILVLMPILGISFKWYIDYFWIPYAFPVVFLFLALRKTKQLYFVKGISSVTRRLGKRMLLFSSYVFTSNVFTLLRKMNDVLLIAHTSGLGNAGIFSYAVFVTNFMDVPQRSMYAITTPLLAVAWKNKDMAKIDELYKKSSITLSIIGMAIFGAIWLSHNNLVLFLQMFRGDDWSIISSIIFVLGLSKMIDLITGVNNQIIQTSSYWRFDFICSVLLVILSVVLIYNLLTIYGPIGAAYADLITVFLWNLIRYLFILVKFKIQPLSVKTLWALLLGAAGIVLLQYIPFIMNIYVDSIVRSGLFLVLYGLAAVKLNLSEDVNAMWNNLQRRLINR